MRVIVCGSRHFEDYSTVQRVLSGIRISELIHGAARGADKLGARYAEENGIPALSFPADWNSFGRRAGAIRNYRMLKEGNPDLVVAFLAPDSRGTKHMIEIAQKAGKPVQVEHVGTPD